MSATDELRALLDERGAEHYDGTETTLWLKDGMGYRASADEGLNGFIQLHLWCTTPEQAIAATLGARKARAHPYGWEPDTGAFDVTRCECGCLNDISATYCNDCGGEIEIDVNHEKELCDYSPWHVFAIKHDDGSLEYDGRRYTAATLGVGMNPDGLPIGLTISDDGTLLNWEGENYVLQSIVRDVKRKPNGNAALGVGECEIVGHYEASTRGEIGRERIKLSCGHIVERHSKYCQECGRKIQKAVKR